jgi:neutral ceramidase
MCSTGVLMILWLLIGPISAAIAADKAPTWQAGAASAVITPKQDMWMAGYAARKKPSEGVAQDLYAKALALKADDGAPLVLVTTDLIGIRRDVRNTVADRCQAQYKLPPERLLLNASHTHCGPEYQPREGREEEAKQYQAFLEQTLVQVVGQALDRLAPATVSYSRGRCGFAMLRQQPGIRRSGRPRCARTLCPRRRQEAGGGRLRLRLP